MILKQLKIKGFKSFPDPVVINFEPDITAIVGPNGSGKSNIVDAIRWALGEQSAKLLRGSRMEDLIFSGSSTRKALDSAEVFLTLDNSDNTLPVEQKEITIGRRVANSGESDYIMNKQVCRLKDIQELIMDTGIGKEAYSIIGQGKIDYLLSSRPQDRREIFEEAAGVMKYKQRKREASRKLERTQQDLVRLEDIIGELENRLKPVAREAKKAKEYEELYARLKELEVAEAGVRWDHLVAEQADYQEELAGIKKSLQLKEKELDEKEGLVQRLEEKKDGLLDRLEEQKELVFKIKTDREQYKNRIEIYKERKENSRQNLDRLEDEQKREQSVLLDNESKIAENRVEQHDSQDKLLALQDEIDQVSRKMAAIQEEIDARNNEKEAINSSLVDYLNEKAEIKNRLALNREKSKDISSEIEEVEEERNQLAAKLDLIMDEEDRVREKLINLREAELQLSRDRDKLESSLSNLQKELEQIEQELQKKKESIQHLDSSLKLLQRLEDQKEGYYRGVKRVLLARDQGHLEDIYGVIAELIEVDARYEQAIAAVLGGRLQNVVVENSEAAKEAIDFLRHNQCGRATFMPLDLIQERSLSTKEKAVLAEEGILGTATDFIEFAPYLAPAVSNLLGRVIVAEDKEAALKAFRSVQGSLLFVTLAGETVNPGGTMTGGSINEKQLDLLTRSRQIEDMREQVEQARQEYAGLADKREEFLASLEKKKQRLEEITRALRQNEMEVLSQQKDLEGLKGESNRLRQEISSLDDRFARFYDKLGALDVESKNLAQELNLIGSDNEEQEELLQQLAVEIEKLKENKEALNEEIVQMRMERASREGKVEHLKGDFARLQETRERTQSRLLELKEEIQVQLNSIHDFSNRISNFQDKLAEIEKDLAQEEAELEEMRADEKEVQLQVKQENVELNRLRRSVQELEKKVNSLDLQVAKIAMEKEQIKERLWEEYGIDIMEVERDETIDLQEASGEVRRLKKKVKGLGPVNPGAIAEYEELKERLEYLHEQHDDLVSAREYLFQIIEQMDGIMEEKFLATFEEVKVHFEDIFRKIFAGGRAELFLTDPDDLLDTGIEINAQPPGKKLQKMSLMSGGEKALTATALIFSLLRVKPSPFYILDEIDAPLDESNVDRFAKFVREFSSVAQFILITHRKRSMAEADALYGVTMEDSGVSKIVSMKLAEQAVS